MVAWYLLGELRRLKPLTGVSDKLKREIKNL